MQGESNEEEKRYKNETKITHWSCLPNVSTLLWKQKTNWVKSKLSWQADPINSTTKEYFLRREEKLLRLKIGLGFTARRGREIHLAQI